ncbi:MAG: tripartite tricarboxylate transporter substrate binding protein [Firmicutes bacterium]|nr:tripartite tricarboxylate transporter substrate binding protein [Bacillota bacterium]
MLLKKNVILTVLVVFLLGLTTSLCGCGSQPAQEGTDGKEEVWPKDTITLVVPYNAGGGVDRLARAVAPFLKEELGVPVIVENKPGGGGIVGTEAFLKETADGSMILHQLQPYVTSGDLRGASFSVNDFAFFANMFGSAQAIFVKSDSPYQNLSDLLDAMTQKRLTFSYIPGSFMLLGPVMLGELVNTEPVGVPYDGGGPSRMALISGEVDFLCSDLYSTKSATGGDTRVLAIFDNERDELFPDYPTVNEELKAIGIDAELPQLGNMYFSVASKELSEKYPDRYEKIVQAYENAFQKQELIDQLNKVGMYPNYLPPEEIERMSKEIDGVINKYKDIWVN